MEIVTLSVGQLKANCYLLICPETEECLIIDPGDEAGFIGEKILRENLKPTTIIATHGHFDHIMAVYELKLAFKIPFSANKKDEKIISRMNQSAKWWLKREIIEQSPKIDQFLKEADKIPFGGEYLEVIETPGHTPGGISLYNNSDKILFCGDIIFENGVARSDFSYSSTTDLKNSLKKIKQKFKGFLVYPGHGPEFYL